MDVDECTELRYCRAHGCTNRPGSYSCNCPEGFTGPQCNTDINECATVVSPCYGRGLCVNVRGPHYQCQCTGGYDPSARCAHPMEVCETGGGQVDAVADVETGQRSTAGVAAILVVIVAEVVIVAALGFVVLRQSTDVVTGYKTVKVWSLMLLSSHRCLECIGSQAKQCIIVFSEIEKTTSLVVNPYVTRKGPQ